MYLFKSRYCSHIRRKHREISLDMLSKIISNPDKVRCERKHQKQEFHISKTIKKIDYIVIIAQGSFIDKSINKGYIITAYRLDTRE